MENFYDYQGNNLDEFIRNYRDALKAQRDSNIKQLEQQRRNNFATIMSGANKAGMLYSNFPERSKVIYNTDSYYPAVAKVQNSYQTGLDSLRTNAINLWNQIRSYNEATEDLNKA